MRCYTLTPQVQVLVDLISPIEGTLDERIREMSHACDAWAGVQVKRVVTGI